MHNQWRNFSWLWGLIPVLFLIAAIFYPLTNLVANAFSGKDQAVFGYASSWHELLDIYYLQRVMITLIQAAVAAAICLLVGIPIALFVWIIFTQQIKPTKTLGIPHWLRFRVKILNLLIRMLLIPFILPVMVVILSIRSIAPELSSEGFRALIVTYVFYNLGLVVWLIFNALLRIPPSIINSAKTLSANNWQIVFYVVLPTIKNSIYSAAALVFLFCSSSFGVAYLVGGQKWATIEVEIYLLSTQSLNLQAASALALIQMLIMLGLASFIFSKSKIIQLTFNQDQNLWQLPKLLISLLFFLVFLLTIVIISPILAQFIGSISVPISSFYKLFTNPDFYLALKNTLVFPLIAVPIAFVISWCSALAAYSSNNFVSNSVLNRYFGSGIFSLVFYSPYMISATVLALGLLIGYPFLGGSMVILIFAYTLIAYPLLARSIFLAWQDHDPQLPLAIVNLGGNKIQAFYHGILPQIMPNLRAGIAFATATMLGEFAATLFLTRPEWLTLSTFIYQYLGKVGQTNYDQANLAASILIIITLFCYYLIHSSKKINISKISTYF